MTMFTHKRLRLGLAVLIFGYQAWAFAQQVVTNHYRPFGAPPGRVPFSWDMFAIQIDRCTIDFSPPIQLPGRTIAHLSDLMPSFEWDLVANDLAGYQYYAALLCYDDAGRARSDSVVTISCAMGTHATRTSFARLFDLSEPQGQVKTFTFACNGPEPQ